MEETPDMEALRQENAALLDELAVAYVHLEEVLTRGSEETEIAYQELRKRNQDLQSRLVELQQTHDQLRETQSLLVRSERLSAMGQMAAAIVHEINNPLTAISGRVELLLMRKDLPYADELEKVRDATQALADLARNILRFARQKGRDAASLETVPINPSVDNVLDFFRPLVKSIQLDVELHAELPQVLGRSVQIEQVLTNFVVNAIDVLKGSPRPRLFVSTGLISPAQVLADEEARGRPASVALSMPAEDMEQRFVYVAVEDNGPGMTQEVMEQIFEAFFTTKSADSGTGLGLSICRTIAESFGGNLLVASKPGDGTCFRLFLRSSEAGNLD